MFWQFLNYTLICKNKKIIHAKKNIYRFSQDIQLICSNLEISLKFVFTSMKEKNFVIRNNVKYLQIYVCKVFTT